MKSVWQRIGRIITPPDDHPWWVEKAQLPTILILAERRWRIFFCARDAANRGHIVSVDVDPKADMQIIEERLDPVVPLGEPGTFDCDGVGAGCFLRIQDRLFLYYAGLNLTGGPIFQASIGALVSTDGGETFQRYFDGPVLNSGPYDPFFVTAPHVQQIGDSFHMWYASTRFWRLSAKPHPEPCYNIKHAVSEDGIHWRTGKEPAIDFAGAHEGGITRPWVRKHRSGYEMWYCYRGKYDPENPAQRAYKIGYATSENGCNWTRRDSEHCFVNPPEPGDWDWAMQCYPAIVEASGTTYMFYCGNGYSREGIGYAIRTGNGSP